MLLMSPCPGVLTRTDHSLRIVSARENRTPAVHTATQPFLEERE